MYSLPTIALKRVIRDIKEINDDDTLKKNGIYITFNENNLTKIRAMIIGPKDTPYEGGFYLFEFTIPQSYPFEPPKGVFMTRDPKGKCRFHPNLYIDGKICLSLLNTWAGESWASTQSLSSVLLSIQSIMGENPLVNEPSFEIVKKGMHDLYNYVVQYENFRTPIIHEMTAPNGLLDEYKCFLPIMEEYFVNNYQSYINKCSALQKEFDGKTVTSPVYSNMTVTFDYASILKSLENIYNTLAPKYSKPKEPIQTTQDVTTPDVTDPNHNQSAESTKKKIVIVKKKL